MYDIFIFWRHRLFTLQPHVAVDAPQNAKHLRKNISTQPRHAIDADDTPRADAPRQRQRARSARAIARARGARARVAAAPCRHALFYRLMRCFIAPRHAALPFYLAARGLIDDEALYAPRAARSHDDDAWINGHDITAKTCHACATPSSRLIMMICRATMIFTERSF